MVILVTSLISSSNIPAIQTPFRIDWAFHFVAYLILSVLSFNVFYNAKNKTTTLIFILIFIFGLLIEFLQSAMKLGRQMDTMDLIFNSLGFFTGYFIYKTIAKANNTIHKL